MIKTDLINKDKNIEAITTALYIVPTPIGNMADMTLRAMDILSNVDIIACEDTRRTGSFLKKLGITYKKLESYHEHNEKAKSSVLAEEIERNGKSVALITDAGTPGISDPGYRLVNETIKRNLRIISLPGATAFVPALAASGLPVHNFVFMGFPPQKKGRQKFLEKMVSLEMTAIIYESSHRIIKLMDELMIISGGERKICAAREISKVHEEYLRGSVNDVKTLLEQKNSIKGEFVVLIAPKK